MNQNGQNVYSINQNNLGYYYDYDGDYDNAQSLCMLRNIDDYDRFNCYSENDINDTEFTVSESLTFDYENDYLCYCGNVLNRNVEGNCSSHSIVDDSPQFMAQFSRSSTAP